MLLATGKEMRAAGTGIGQGLAPESPCRVEGHSVRVWVRTQVIRRRASRPIHDGDGERAALRSANWIWTPVPSTVQLYLANSARR